MRAMRVTVLSSLKTGVRNQQLSMPTLLSCSAGVGISPMCADESLRSTATSKLFFWKSEM